MRIDEIVVLWHVDLLEDARALVAAVMANEAAEVSLGGGVTAAPEPVRDACGVREVWASGPRLVSTGPQR